jgi:hypothetical protein
MKFILFFFLLSTSFLYAQTKNTLDPVDAARIKELRAISTRANNVKSGNCADAANNKLGHIENCCNDIGSCLAYGQLQITLTPAKSTSTVNIVLKSTKAGYFTKSCSAFHLGNIEMPSDVTNFKCSINRLDATMNISFEHKGKSVRASIPLNDPVVDRAASKPSNTFVEYSGSAVYGTNRDKISVLLRSQIVLFG